MCQAPRQQGRVYDFLKGSYIFADRLLSGFYSRVMWGTQTSCFGNVEQTWPFLGWESREADGPQWGSEVELTHSGWKIPSTFIAYKEKASTFLLVYELNPSLLEKKKALSLFLSVRSLPCLYSDIFCCLFFFYFCFYSASLLFSFWLLISSFILFALCRRIEQHGMRKLFFKSSQQVQT